MYKKTESATMEIAFGVCDHKIISKCLEFCFKSNIERLIVNIDDFNVKEVPFIIREAEKNQDLCVFFRCYENTYQSLRSFCNSMPVILILENLENIILEQYDFTSLFLEITFNGIIYPKFDKLKSSIIWDLPFSDTNWQQFDDLMEILMQQYDNDDLMIKQILLSKSLIKEHPCNVYLCSSSHCHSKHGNFPRMLYISDKGDIFPYGIEDNCICIGNIISEYEILCNEYNDSAEKQKFINLNRELYLEIIDKSCYELIPWFELIKVKLNEC